MRILFLDRHDESALLKATTTKTVIVPGHTRNGGRYVAPYAKIVHVNPDVPMADVIAGKGSFSQKLAHKKLHAKVPGFANLPEEEQGIHILSSGTNIQKWYSQSSAVSGWKDSLLAGKKPTKSQAEAFAALRAKNPQAAYAKQQEVVAAIGIGKFAELASMFIPANGPTKDAALQAAIDHLSEDAKQADIPAHEKKEDSALVEKLKAAKESQPESDEAGVDFDLHAFVAGAPVPKKQKATIDGMATGTNAADALKYTVSANKAANPHIAAYAQKKIDEIQAANGADAADPFPGFHAAEAENAALVEKLEAAKTLIAVKKASYSDEVKKEFTVERYGVPGQHSDPKSGVFFSPEGKAAEEYSGDILKFTIPAGIKLYRGVSSQEFAEELGLMDVAYPGLKDAFGYATLAGVVGASVDEEINQDAMYDAFQYVAKKELDAAGYQGAYWSEEEDLAPEQYQIWGIDVISQTKHSQVAESLKETGEAAVAAAKLKEIGDGKGGHYAGIAYKKLQSNSEFQASGSAKRLEMTVNLAKELQQIASDSSAASGWKKIALAGNNPKPAQWTAFLALDADKKSKLLDEVKAKHGNWNHLKADAASILGSANKPEPKVILPVGPKDGDTKAGADGPLVFKNGRWHKHDQLHGQSNALGSLDDGGPDKQASIGTLTTYAATTPHQSLGNEGKIYEVFAHAIAVEQKLGLKPGSLADATGYSDTYTVQSSDGKTFSVYSHAGVVRVRTSGKNKDESSAEALVAFLDGVEPSAPVVQQPVSQSTQGKNLDFTTYHNTTDGHSKFWSVAVDGAKLVTKYGKIGANGTSTVKEFASHMSAVNAAHKLMDQKKAKGYLLYDDTQTTDSSEVNAKPQKPDVKGTWGDVVNGIEAAIDSGNLQHILDNVAMTSGFEAPDAKATNDYAVAAMHFLKDQPEGPKEGDTKQGADGLLVFKNGRWHKQSLAEKLNAIPLPPLVGFKYPIKAMDVLKKLLVDAENVGPAAFKGKIIHSASGKTSITLPESTGGNYKVVCYPSSFGNEYAEYVEAVKAATLAHFGRSGPKPTAPTSASTAPSAPPPAKPEPKVIFSATKNGITAIDGWQQTGPQKGSNPGGTFKDSSGQQWYVKFPATEDHARNELLASKLYKAAGVDVPTLRLVSKDGKIGVASKIVDGVSKVGESIKNAAGALEGFAVDAWLGNYDSVGTGYDNLLQTKDGKAIRIDVGGSLLFRAQGAPKGEAFGNDVSEIDGMRDKTKNTYGSAVFGGITKDKLNESVALVIDIPDDVIKQIVSKFGPGTDRDALASKLIARKNDLAKRFPEADLIANPPKPDPRNLPVDASNLPKKPDFLNWNGTGNGLSSVEKVNVSNQKAVDEIYAAAMKGDYVAIKKLKYHVVDKQTGEAKEGTSFGDHPSQHVRNFYSSVIDHMEVIANPSAKKQKAWNIEDYSDIMELSDAFKAHLYGISVGAVPADQRLGFWISLGQAESAKQFVPQHIDYVSAADNAKGKKSIEKMPAHLKKWMAAVKGSGSANVPYREGKEIDNQGQKTRDVLEAAYHHSVEFAEGTMISKDIGIPPAMLKQMLALDEGHVFQNPGSMCCSLNKNWSWSSHDPKLEIIYAKGAKALYNIGVGSHNHEGEITTIPGQRFMLLEKDNSGSLPVFKLLMLPPDENYVANIKPKA